MLSHSVVSDSVTLQTAAHQAPLSMGFSRQEYWSGLHVLLQEIFPIQGSNPHLLCLLHCWWILHLLNHQENLRSDLVIIVSEKSGHCLDQVMKVKITNEGQIETVYTHFNIQLGLYNPTLIL